jgi:hypothetical protein
MSDPVHTPTDQPSTPVNGEAMTAGAIRNLGIYFILLGLILFYLAFVIWPPDYQSLFRPGMAEEQTWNQIGVTRVVECLHPTGAVAQMDSTPKP